MSGLPAGIGAGVLVGAVHMALFQRGVGLAFATGRPAAARGLILVLSGLRFLMTATAGLVLIRSGVSALGLGIGLLIALYVHRAGLLAWLPKEGAV